jgi:hypothetical protein
VGRFGFPHLALAIAMTKLERMTRLQLRKDIRPDASF